MIEKNWLKIGEVAQSLGISPKELRYWEQVVPEIRPRRSRGNLRYYHREELPRLARIRDWLAEGLTVADCRQLLLTGQLKRGFGFEPEPPPEPPPADPAPAETKTRPAGPRKAARTVEAGPASPRLAKAREALSALLDRLRAAPAPAGRRRTPPREAAPADPVPPLDARPEVPPTASVLPDPEPAPPKAAEKRGRPKKPAAETGADAEPPRPPRPRKKPTAPPAAEPESFGPLFDLGST